MPIYNINAGASYPYTLYSGADATQVNDPMTFAVRDMRMEISSTLYNANVLLALMAIHTHQKPDELFGLGDPTAATVITGAKLPGVKIKELTEINQVDPLIETYEITDFIRKAYRGATADASTADRVAYNPTGPVQNDPTFVVTTVNGTITGVAVTANNTVFSGSLPTLVVVDATGSCGYGAILVPTTTATTGGYTITGITVKNGGVGYAVGTGVSILIHTAYRAGVAVGTDGQLYSRPVFKWAEMEQVAYLYNRDIDAALAMGKVAADSDGGKEIMFGLTKDSIQGGIGKQAQQINNDLWYGVPTTGLTDSAPMYDQPWGLLAAIDDGSGTGRFYGGIDRAAVESYWWRAKVDAAQHPSWTAGDLVNDALQNKGLAYKGHGIDAFVVNPGFIARCTKEFDQNTQQVDFKEEIRELGKYGFKQKVLCYGGVYFVGDWRCPAGTGLGLNFDSLFFNFKQGKKFQPSKMYDQKGLPGGMDGLKYFINTQIMPMVWAPNLNVKYTGLPV